MRQVDTYRDLLTNFLTIFDGHPETVQGAVFLHNVSQRAAVAELDDYHSDLCSEMFIGADIETFAAFLKTRVSPVRDAGVVDRFMESAVAPSQQLPTSAAAEIRDREQFVLLDRQQQAVDLVLHAVDRADNKRVIVVSGGPGTGKSTVALSLLGELSRRGKKVLHATGSQAFKQTMAKVAGHRHRATQAKLKPDYEASEYTTLKRLARKQEREGVPADARSSAVQRLRNGYRVLLTRGMKGVVVYSTDPATQQLLKSLVNPE
ncbi:DNA/RNA helicase domain-containing protein [uncultured Corynebacterium sp.]|uniref:DNA/RNA helicase domain-containing protein n=1 Tax=uncultured Corynebacterium sp. TaxID=159447 RepID=UPI0025CE3DEB|nr:DNA/RNA helicase domain-containing protein [uncultured Corynebacterium sp.]